MGKSKLKRQGEFEKERRKKTQRWRGERVMNSGQKRKRVKEKVRVMGEKMERRWA